VSDLDRAIRDRLARSIDETMEHRNGLTSILPGTDMARVLDSLTAVLDWANGLESGVSGPSHIGKAFADQLRQVIADGLGVSAVSSQDTPAPRPAPRVFKDAQMAANGDPWRWFEVHPGLLTYAPDWPTAREWAPTTTTGIGRNLLPDAVRASYGELTDVTTEVLSGDATGDQR
jgi:hypothetical protein